MSSPLVQDLIESGIHFGQRSSGWNPKMQRYIYGKRNGIHIIDIKETIKGLLLAKQARSPRPSPTARTWCFVGTKRQARRACSSSVCGDVNMHWVTERWLGGTLTNFRTIRSRLKRLEELEAIAEPRTTSSGTPRRWSPSSAARCGRSSGTSTASGAWSKLPGALVIAIDVRRERDHRPSRGAEARHSRRSASSTPTATPNLADIPIPGNDDSMRSIDVIVRELCLAIADGQQSRTATPEDAGAEEAKPAEDAKPRRSSRSQYRADDSNVPAPEAAPAGTETPAPAES